MRCFVCYEESDIQIDVKAGDFLIEMRLCKECFRKLTAEKKILAMCIICGGFRLIDSLTLAKYTGVLEEPIPNKVNVAFLKACPDCGGDLDNITDHA
jgi:rRNA maturation endonuclease Nob1